MNHRHAVFSELHRLVDEYDEAVAAPNADARWNVDDALSALIIRLNGETRRARKLQKTEGAEVCNAA